jgi:hypothetical protein
MISIEDIKNKLNPSVNHNETRIYFGKIISSNIFNGQLNSNIFQLLESKIKKSCKLATIPYMLFNEYCYDEYTYYNNTKTDKLFKYSLANSTFINCTDINCKINYLNIDEPSTFYFNSQMNYQHIQPFSEASLKIGEHIFIKLRKNLYSYDLTSPVSSYQIYIIYKNINETKTEKEYNLNLLSNIIADLLDQHLH